MISIRKFYFYLLIAAAFSAVIYSCPLACTECAVHFPDFCTECKPGFYLENSACKSCHSDCVYCNGPLKTDCLPENFYKILNTHRLLPSGDVSTLPYSATLQSGFTISYDYSPDGTMITMLLSFSLSSGWFAIGFGSSMSAADVIACIPGSGTITCGDYYSSGYVSPSQDTSVGGTNDVTMLGYDVSSSPTLVKFQRKLNTGDSKDAVITPGPNAMIWAYQSRSTSFSVKHSSYGSQTVDLTPTTNKTGDGVNTGEDPLEETHGFLIFFGWGVAVDIGLIFMALGRKYPFYITLHAITMWYTVVSTLITEAIMISARGLGSGDVSNVHFAIGIAIMTLMILQHIGGITIITISKGRKISNRFHKMRLGHRWNGLLIYLLAKTNIFVGVYLHDSIWFPWMIPIQATLILLNILVRVWMKYRSTNYQDIDTTLKTVTTLLQKKIVAEINSGKSREELLNTFPETKFAYLFNRIYDLSAFEHPGGNFILSAVKGRELGRFLYGAYSLEEANHKRFHHKTTDVAILNKYYIGKINQDQNSILVNHDRKSVTTGDFKTWTFVKKIELTKSIASFEFQNPNYQIKNDLNNVSHFGRHFYLAKDLIKGPIRPYTICLSLGESWVNFRKMAVEYFAKKMQANESAALVNTLPLYSDNINLVVKRYTNPTNLAMSEFLHSELGNTKSILLNGPVGTGLELSGGSRGTHYVFAVGTGILPFMDLLNFILFKSMYLALKQNYGEAAARQLNSHGTDYENALSNDFRLVIFVAFANKEETVGYDIIKKAAEINSKYNLNIFEAHVKGADHCDFVTKFEKKLDHNFIGGRVNAQASKFYVCGSPLFNHGVPEDLKRLGVNPLKIVLV